jgi:hypothetical protein
LGIKQHNGHQKVQTSIPGLQAAFEKMEGIGSSFVGASNGAEWALHFINVGIICHRLKL